MQCRHPGFLSLRIVPEELQQHSGILRLVIRLCPDHIPRPLRSTHSLTSLHARNDRKNTLFLLFYRDNKHKKAPFVSTFGVFVSTFRIFGVFKKKEKRAPKTDAFQVYFRIFDITENVTKPVKSGVNRCKGETGNHNILCVSGAFTARYCGFQVLVEMMGIEPMSENPLTQPSSWTVCYLGFPLRGASRHAPPFGSTLLPDRFECQPPVQVHR